MTLTLIICWLCLSELRLILLILIIISAIFQENVTYIFIVIFGSPVGIVHVYLQATILLQKDASW